jgi:endonuclease/exonuclease/phosphatase family metal-dependent hydrolase
MYLAFIWNGAKVRALRLESFDLPLLDLAGKALFDRIPIVGYFEAVFGGEPKNDFLLVNVHLASSQDNDENHLIAMTLIEYELNSQLEEMRVKESDRIILGDFNDNPYATRETGTKKYSSALYHHMEFKGYRDFVVSDFHSTRMDSKLESVIDHVLINDDGQREIVANSGAEIWLPPGGPSEYAAWRQTYSDHFPITITIEVKNDRDVDWSE